MDVTFGLILLRVTKGQNLFIILYIIMNKLGYCCSNIVCIAQTYTMQRYGRDLAVNTPSCCGATAN